MAKKRNTNESQSRSGDRHKGGRHTITLRADEYEALVALATRNSRPVLWELRRILHAVLKEAGLWPPPSDESQKPSE